ncbi:hypothetical protein GGI11_006547, partial [Coemansia sp. RSA 2049]
YIRANPVELQRPNKELLRQQSDDNSDSDSLGRPVRDDIALRPLSLEDFEIPSRAHLHSLGQAYNLNEMLSSLNHNSVLD